MGVKGAWKRAMGIWVVAWTVSTGDRLVDSVIVPREIAASVEPAHRSENVATLTGGLAHDVSILLGVGRHLGSQPRAKTSITIMRAPQCGHGQGSRRGASGAISDCCCGSAAGGATSRNARAVDEAHRRPPLWPVQARQDAHRSSATHGVDEEEDEDDPGRRRRMVSRTMTSLA